MKRSSLVTGSIQTQTSIKAKNMPQEAVGLFGGRFDPVHRAHIDIATEAANSLNLKEVRWIISATPPHKPAVASAQHRLEMVRLALAELNDPRMVLDNREIQTGEFGRPNYTADTLTTLKQDLPDKRFIWVLGADQLEQFSTWNRWKWLIDNMELAIYDRPGVDTDKLFLEYKTKQAKLHKINAKLYNISSSDIRSKIRQGKNVCDDVPKSVFMYLKKNRLYRGDHSPISTRP